MIEIAKTKTGYRTVINCDVCMERITDVGMAVAVRFTSGIAWHLHKGKCHDRAERMVPVFKSGFMELSEHLDQMNHNTRLDVGTQEAAT